MANDRIIKLTIVGQSDSAQKALKATGDAATQAEVKVEGFGKAFAKAGVALGVGAAAGGAIVGVMREASAAVGDYNISLDQSTKLLLGQTKSQEETAKALAVARAEADKGRGTYQELAAAMAGLTTVANLSGQSLERVTEIAEILAAINPEEGIKGATFALREAATGDFTSVIERFNLSRTTINRLKAEGVPAIEAVRRAMEEMGYDAKFLDTANQSQAKQWQILTGRLTEFAAIAGKPIMDKLIEGVGKLNKAAAGDGGMSFAQLLARDLEELLAGRGIQRGAIGLQQALVVIAASFNDFLKTISGGEINIDGPLKAFIASIRGQEAELRRAVEEGVARPVQEGFDNASKPKPAQVASFEGLGRAYLRAVVRGVTAEQLESSEKIAGIFGNLFNGADGKADPDKVARGQGAVAAALRDIARDGQVSADTMRDLSEAFGMQTPEVYKLIEAQGRLDAAQRKAKQSVDDLAAANDRLQQVRNRAKGDLAGYERGIAAAQAAAAAQAEKAASAIEDQQKAMAGARAEAEAAARANQAEVDRLQGELDGLAAAAAARQQGRDREVAAAQAQYEQAQNRRQQLQGAMNAALRGEVEEWLRINDITDESIRKIAEKWQEEIAGQRRAKEGADQKVKELSRQGNKEELDYLNRIDAARAAGNEKEARRLERERDARRKQRGSEEERARAAAAVANDEYDEKREQLERQGKKADENASAEERAALANLNRIKDAAAAQKAADDAALAAKRDQIKAVQDAGKAEQARYADQQRGIQAEIDRLNDAAKVQAAKDKQAITDAQTQKTLAEGRWAAETTGATLAVGLFSQIAGHNKSVADDSKTAYDWLEKITKLDFSNLKEAAQNARTIVDPRGTMPGGRSPYDETPPYVPPAPSRGGGGGDRPQQDPGQTSSLPGYLRAAPEPSGGESWTLQIVAPNLTDLGNRRQQAELVAAMRRELKGAIRGGIADAGVTS